MVFPQCDKDLWHFVERLEDIACMVFDAKVSMGSMGINDWSEKKPRSICSDVSPRQMWKLMMNHDDTLDKARWNPKKHHFVIWKNKFINHHQFDNGFIIVLGIFGDNK